MSQSPILFCPFCRDPFEGLEVCPTHDLKLVRLSELPPSAEELARREAEHLALFSPRAGRGWLIAAAACLIVGFFCPSVVITARDHVRMLSTLDLATRVAPNLWALPAVAASYVAILARRRTPLAMRAVRVALAVLSLFAVASTGLTAWRLLAGAEAARSAVMPTWGALPIACALAMGFVAALRFGQPARA